MCRDVQRCERDETMVGGVVPVVRVGRVVPVGLIVTVVTKIRVVSLAAVCGGGSENFLGVDASVRSGARQGQGAER